MNMHWKMLQLKIARIPRSVARWSFQSMCIDLSIEHFDLMYLYIDAHLVECFIWTVGVVYFALGTFRERTICEQLCMFYSEISLKSPFAQIINSILYVFKKSKCVFLYSSHVYKQIFQEKSKSMFKPYICHFFAQKQPSVMIRYKIVDVNVIKKTQQIHGMEHAQRPLPK